MLAPQSIGLAMVTVVSRCVGAGDFDKARAYTRKRMKWGYLYMLLTNILLFGLQPLVLRLYNISPEATGYANIILWSHGIAGVLLWPLAFRLPQMLRSAGDTRFTMLISSASMWTFRVFLGLLFARVLDFGVLGIWYAMYIDWAFRAVCFILRYRGHRWEFKGLKE